jgi:hypothetical protein
VEFSTNATVWTAVGRIPITNKHQGAYSYTHPQVPAGILYYRIRQTDKDGAFVYSAVVMLRQAEEGEGLAIYPNPVRDQLYIALPGQAGASMVLYDAAGRALISQPYLTGTSSILTANLPDGIYLLSLQDQSGRKTTRKIVVKH